MKPCVAVINVVVFACVVGALMTAAAAKKTKSSAHPFTDAVPHLRCQTCKAMVHESVLAANDLRENATKTGKPLREETLFDEILEVVCNPYAARGQWIRRGDIRVSDDEKNIGIVFHETFGKCKRDCVTIAEACTAVLDSEQADELPAMLLKNKKSPAQLEAAVCASFCKDSSSKPPPRNRRLRREWGAEAHDEIEAKEMEIEEMMDRMQRTRQAGEPGMDVFSRDEMLAMQNAMREGDIERMAEFDPSAADLTPEDLAMLRKMQAEGGADDEAAEGDSGVGVDETGDADGVTRGAAPRGDGGRAAAGLGGWLGTMWRRYFGA